MIQGEEEKEREENLNDETRPAAVVLVRLLMIVIAPREKKNQAQQFVCYFLYLFSVFFFCSRSNGRSLSNGVIIVQCD